jgi:hypothetical protein
MRVVFGIPAEDIRGRLTPSAGMRAFALRLSQP